MDASFWHQKWAKNEIGFHFATANPMLVNYFEALSLAPGSRVFLPLCGKTLDIGWLLAGGYRVAGVELSELAVRQLFSELQLAPEITELDHVKHFRAQHIDIFVGDIFDLSGTLLGPVDAIYDRAALVALPESMRTRYTAHLITMTTKAAQLLICFEYDQSLMDGPPFSISDEELHRHYGRDYELTLLVSADLAGGLKGQCAAKEKVWLLSG